MPRWLFWPLFAGVFGFVLGGSIVWGISYPQPVTDHRPTEQTEHSDSTPTNAPDQKNRSAGAVISVPQVPASNLTSESAAQCQQCAAQQEKGWWDKFKTDPNAAFAFSVALFTLALVGVGAWQARRLRQSVEATNIAVQETRRIGEAQIKAYVDVNSAEIFFVGLGVLGIQAHPIVRIIATNTGQSPAKNFIWNPTVQYFSAGIGTVPRSLTKELGSNWRDILGVGITVGQSHPDVVMVPEMELFKFLGEGSGEKGMVLVRLRIQFEFEDVFDRRNTEEAYFAGMFKRMEGQTQTPWGETQWSGKLDRLHRPRDWPA